MEETGFKKKWSNFGSIIFSPGSGIALLLAVISQGFAIIVFTGALSNLLSIFASISAAIAAIFIKDDWDKLQGNSMLEKKGKSALRNLDAINQQVIQIRRWIRGFITKKETAKRELEEIDRHLDTMVMHLKSGLADWIDIVPELKQKEEVSKSYDETIKAFIEERLENQKKLLNAGTDKDLKIQLEKRIKELEEKVKVLRKEQYGVFSSPGIAIGSASLSPSMSPNIISISNSNKKKCIKCGKQYNDDFFGLGYPLSSENICSECKSLIS